MSIERYTNEKYTLTTFYGGSERGPCLQITPQENSGIQLTKTELLELVKQLLDASEVMRVWHPST